MDVFQIIELDNVILEGVREQKKGGSRSEPKINEFE